MYGWRARLGLILPMDNAVLEPEFSSLGLPGVAAYAVRLGTRERREMPEAGVEASAIFNELGVDAVGYACAETSFIGGQDANAAVCQGIEEQTGRPVVTATAAMIEALEVLGARAVAIAAPYREASAQALKAYLERSRIKVVGLESRDFASGSADPREWYETNLQPPSVSYQMARRADTDAADALVISATNLRTFEIISALEQDTGKPVISSNSALIWALLRRCGVHVSVPALGRLWGLHDE